jgi:hypothetical protein
MSHISPAINVISYYLGFEYNAGQLSKFLSAFDLFTILLKDGRIVHFTAADPVSFRLWLYENNVTDIAQALSA